MPEDDTERKYYSPVHNLRYWSPIAIYLSLIGHDVPASPKSHCLLLMTRFFSCYFARDPSGHYTTPGWLSRQTSPTNHGSRSNFFIFRGSGTYWSHVIMKGGGGRQNIKLGERVFGMLSEHCRKITDTLFSHYGVLWLWNFYNSSTYCMVQIGYIENVNLRYDSLVDGDRILFQ